MVSDTNGVVGMVTFAYIRHSFGKLKTPDTQCTLDIFRVVVGSSTAHVHDSHGNGCLHGDNALISAVEVCLCFSQRGTHFFEDG